MDAVLSSMPSLNVDRAPALYVVLWVFQPLALFFIVGRLYVRIRRRQLGSDDWCILASWTLQLVADIGVTVMLSRGGIRHIQYMSFPVLQESLNMQAWIFPFPTVAITLGKTGVALLLLRLLEHASTWRRAFIIATVALYWALTVTLIGVAYGQCQPASALWDLRLRLLGQAKCMDPAINAGVSVAQNSFGAFIDFAFAVLPFSIFWSLNIPLAKRAACCVLLGLGGFAGICASVKCAAAWRNRNSRDPTWDAFDLFLWTSLELHSLIIAGCIPVAKPLFDTLVYGTPIVKSDAVLQRTPESYRLESAVVVKETTFGSVETRAIDSRDDGEHSFSAWPPSKPSSVV